MKKAYFAAPFLIDGDGSLKNDIRARILGSVDKLLIKKHEDETLVIYLDGTAMEYTGPFYYEETANGVFTDSDCFGVVRKELDLIDACDMLIALFDGNLAPGTVAELIYAAQAQKEIFLLYKRESADYDIDSLYWYPIVAAQVLNASVATIPFDEIGEVLARFGVESCE